MFGTYRKTVKRNIDPLFRFLFFRFNGIIEWSDDTGTIKLRLTWLGPTVTTINSETKLASYYFGKSKGKRLIDWDIQMLKKDGRSLFYSQDTDCDFPIFYKALFQTDKDVENTKATTLLISLILPKLEPNRRDCLDVNMSKKAMMPWISSTIKFHDQMAFHSNILNINIF